MTGPEDEVPAPAPEREAERPPQGDAPESELLAARRAKLERLRAAGVDPFPHQYPGVVPIAEVRAGHAQLGPGQETDAAYRVAGRLVARRGQGGAAFLDLVDRSGRIQLHARVDVLGFFARERRRFGGHRALQRQRDSGRVSFALRWGGCPGTPDATQRNNGPA